MDSPSQSPEMQESATVDNVEGRSQLEPKSITLKRAMGKVGLDAPSLVLMTKGSIPPIIGISIYQATPIYTYFTTMGYLIPVTSVLALAILPRDRFMQNLILNLLVICVGSAISLLALWSSIQARIHTSPPASQGTATAPPPYNSSQSAVCAVWLFTNIWFANLVRAKLPSFGLPVVIYSILINTSTTLGPMITTTTAAESFVKEQFLAMVFGVGIAAGVALFVFPTSSRMVVIGEFKGLIGLLRKIVGLQKEYLVAVTKEDTFSIERSNAAQREVWWNKKAEKKGTDEAVNRAAKTAQCLKETVSAIRDLAGKTHSNMTCAKRDMAWGKLDSNDLGETFTLIWNVTIPIVAINSVIDIFQRISKRRKWNVDEGTPPEIAAEKNRERQLWNDVMNQMQTPFQILAETIDQGIEHSGIRLEILPRPKACKTSRSRGSDDVEAKGDEINPDHEGFAELVGKNVQQFKSQTSEILRARARGRTNANLTHSQDLAPGDAMARNQDQVFLIIYMQQLMHAAGEAVQDLVAFADEKVEDGTMKRRRFLFPSERVLWKWLRSMFKPQNSSGKQSPDILETNSVSHGHGYNQKKDREYLPATSIWQHFGNGLRKISAVLGSKESAFGFRVACAAMTVGIVAFLKQTQKFFQDQRLDWAMITIALGMAITSGQSIFGFFCRVGGTCLGMIVSLISWYIVDQKTPGVIVLLWFFIFIEYYFFKFPRFIPAVIMTILTQIIIIGYELQVRRLGEAKATETGQPYYPTYLLGPYRLAVVAGGSLVAFFWTIFPSPLTDRTWLREHLSVTIYLLANYFSITISSMQSQLAGTASDIESDTSPDYHLLKSQRKIVGKVTRLMSSIESHVAWQRWEPTIGGCVPVRTYQEIIVRSRHILSYLTLMSYTLSHPPRMHKMEDSNDERLEDRAAGGFDAHIDAQEDRRWQALARILPGTEPTYHAVLSTLIILSNSMLSGQSLPPSLLLPRRYETIRRLVQRPQDSTFAESDQDSAPLLPHHDFSRGSGNPWLATIDLFQETPDDVAGKCTRGDPQSQSEQADIAFPRNTRPLDADLELRGYAEFVAVQLCNMLVCDDLEGLVRGVSRLVGIVDFNFRVDVCGRDSRTSNAVELPLTQWRGSRIVAAKGKERRRPSC